jgi:DNA-binding protein HU-beta
LNKQTFINNYAEKTEQTKKIASVQVDAFIETLKQALISDNKIQFIGDFSINIVDTKARKGVNPGTGAEIDIPAGKKLKIKSGKTFDIEVLGK